MHALKLSLYGLQTDIKLQSNSICKCTCIHPSSISSNYVLCRDCELVIVTPSASNIVFITIIIFMFSWLQSLQKHQKGSCYLGCELESNLGCSIWILTALPGCETNMVKQIWNRKHGFDLCICPTNTSIFIVTLYVNYMNIACLPQQHTVHRANLSTVLIFLFSPAPNLSGTSLATSF